MSEEFEPVEGCAGCVGNTAVEDAVAVEAPHFAPGGSDSAPHSRPTMTVKRTLEPLRLRASPLFTPATIG